MGSVPLLLPAPVNKCGRGSWGGAESRAMKCITWIKCNCAVLLLMPCCTATHTLLYCYSCLALPLLMPYWTDTLALLYCTATHCCVVLHAACGVDQWYLQAILASMTQTHGTSQVRQTVAGPEHATGEAGCRRRRKSACLVARNHLDRCSGGSEQAVAGDLNSLPSRASCSSCIPCPYSCSCCSKVCRYGQASVQAGGPVSLQPG